MADRSLEDEAVSGGARWARLALLIGLAAWTWRFAANPLGMAVMDSFLHLPNLVFHEAGHVVFSPFGRFLTVLGGSLLQFLVPVVLAVSFVRQEQPFSATVCAWWAGQNLVDLAPYIADARALQLVLLGGRTSAEVEGHDWEYLLATLGMSHLDRTIGLWSHYTGVLLMVAAIGTGAWLLYRSGRPDLHEYSRRDDSFVRRHRSPLPHHQQRAVPAGRHQSR